ncbi:MAG: ABC transporter substrate-binding protein [Deltaproteobacteria bacterium]|nr:ABC transporter substrate-binding protein [Deltaproteobacteria bacterium]MBW1847755.1 ABC transporter substrate-binding protein [Deltaproteobacteria bacterium]MBW1984082.1 ABC transporter substrate-binding protein [Deltaproteobacteria bacterium]MBW2181939.1 ABC transporter substrate-binding protein [Deltaproteobacteria bacterium]MBW2365104.1 ABC transporter substrate-binding protein [Deltaproteobacteria bacterium]
MKKKSIRTIIASVLVILLILSVDNLDLFAAEKNIIRVGINQDVSTLFVNLNTGADFLLTGMVYQGPIWRDYKTGNFFNLLAKSVTVLKNKKDVKIVLRKDARFHTGDPVTAHDAKFTYDLLSDVDNRAPGIVMFEEIENVEIVDDYTYILHFWEPFAPWRQVAYMAIYSKEHYDRVGLEKFRKTPVGSGAFRFVERKPSEYVLFEAVENHPDYNIGFKTLRLIPVSDDISRLAMLETGELDLIAPIQPHQVERLKQNKNIQVKVNRQSSSMIAVSLKGGIYPIMYDSKLTTGINHAINRQEMVDKFFFSEGYPLYRYCSKSEYGYNPDFKYEYNPDKARRLISQSSYKPDMKLVFSYSSDVPNAGLVMTSFQKYLKEVGINCEIQQLELGTMLTYNRDKDKRLGHGSLFTWGVQDDPYWRLALAFRSTGWANGCPDRPNKDLIDKLVDKQEREIDHKKRLALIEKIHQSYMKTPGIAALFGLNTIYAMNNQTEYNWPGGGQGFSHLDQIKIIK